MINTVRDAVAWKYTMRNATVSCNKFRLFMLEWKYTNTRAIAYCIIINKYYIFITKRNIEVRCQSNLKE